LLALSSIDWKFLPGKINGENVASLYSLTIDYFDNSFEKYIIKE